MAGHVPECNCYCAACKPECGCGLQHENLCTCKDPRVRLYPLNQQPECALCSKWMCRCVPPYTSMEDWRAGAVPRAVREQRHGPATGLEKVYDVACDEVEARLVAMWAETDPGARAIKTALAQAAFRQLQSVLSPLASSSATGCSGGS